MTLDYIAAVVFSFGFGVGASLVLNLTFSRGIWYAYFICVIGLVLGFM